MVMKKEKNIKRGRRNRQRGAELQHEKGDIELEDKYFGCKRRKSVPRWVLPEKQEEGVFFREDRGELMVAIPADLLFFMMSMVKKDLNKN